jgi:hypothetical protein
LGFFLFAFSTLFFIANTSNTKLTTRHKKSRLNGNEPAIETLDFPAFRKIRDSSAHNKGANSPCQLRAGDAAREENSPAGRNKKCKATDAHLFILL